MNTVPALSERFAEVRDRIRGAARRAGRNESEVVLVAISKSVDPALIAAAIELGQTDFGENRAQELEEHAAAVGVAPTVRWHFVGRLQTNKVKRVAGLVACWQSVDRQELGPVLARHAPGARVLVQVNIGGEPQKGGCSVAGAPGLVDRLRADGLLVDGLMTVPPAATDPRPVFDALRRLRDTLGLRELSMGMSGDYEQAIVSGATIVRVGSALFGARPGPNPAPR